ncbi:hypothetical protein GH714_017883 [Hevea brasiliensis]|uniref:NAC domain-containing protein n=1 Tax=Hevea brasiliensis TaxID=3981 RepID=A0A6A6NI99_HEVBR|nr:hypothetical protein GH714_017883 [Hevea brasiliensis]
MEENLPPGFRFHPTDEELITFYLTRKVSDVSFTSKAIVDVDLNKCEPWDLPDKASMGEKEWYFFSLRDRKYPTGLRTNRATEAGYWKTTGKDKEIFRGAVLVGMKKTLVFYKGRAPRGEKSNWVMHEYRLENKHPFKRTKEEWVVGSSNQIEVFRATHTKKDSVDVFIYSKSRRIDGDFSSAIVEKYGSNYEFQLVFDVGKWLTASGSLNKGRVYGFGNSDIGKSQNLGSSTPYSCTLVHPSHLLNI